VSGSDAGAVTRASYVALRVRGVKQLHAAKQVGIHVNTANHWEKEPWFEPACVEERARWLGDKRTALEPLMPQAVANITTLLTAGDPDMAKWAFDHFFGKAMQPTTSDNHHEIGAILAEAIKSVGTNRG
jgi:hypothetical protein